MFENSVRGGGSHPHHPSGDADDRRIIRYRVYYHRARANLDVVTDHDTAQNFRAGSDHHVVADRRMAFPLLVAGPAECNTLVDQNVVANFRSLADNNARTVIDEKTPPDLRSRVDFNAGQKTRNLRDEPRNDRDVRLVQPMRETVQQNGVEAGVTEEDFNGALRRWVFTKYGIDLFPDSGKHASNSTGSCPA